MAKIEIHAVGHAFLAGARGDAGGAPSKNSLWGVAKIGRDLVTFSGRVGGKLKFKAEDSKSLDVLKLAFKDKVAGLGCAVPYRDVTRSIDKIDDGLVERMASDYKEAKVGGKVTTRKMPYTLA